MNALESYQPGQERYEHDGVNFSIMDLRVLFPKSGRYAETLYQTPFELAAQHSEEDVQVLKRFATLEEARGFIPQCKSLLKPDSE